MIYGYRLRKENPERGRKQTIPMLIRIRELLFKKRKPRKGTETQYPIA